MARFNYITNLNTVDYVHKNKYDIQLTDKQHLQEDNSEGMSKSIDLSLTRDRRSNSDQTTQSPIMSKVLELHAAITTRNVSTVNSVLSNIKMAVGDSQFCSIIFMRAHDSKKNSLHLASKIRSVDIIEELFTRVKDLPPGHSTLENFLLSVDEDGNNALHIAAMNKNSTVLEKPLQTETYFEDNRVVEKLLSTAIDLKDTTLKNLLLSRGVQDQNAVHKAAGPEGNVHVLRTLFRYAKKIKDENIINKLLLHQDEKLKNTPLHIAVNTDDIDIVSTILTVSGIMQDKDATKKLLCFRNNSNKTAIDISIADEVYNISRLLLKVDGRTDAQIASIADKDLKSVVYHGCNYTTDTTRSKREATQELENSDADSGSLSSAFSYPKHNLSTQSVLLEDKVTYQLENMEPQIDYTQLDPPVDTSELINLHNNPVVFDNGISYGGTVASIAAAAALLLQFLGKNSLIKNNATHKSPKPPIYEKVDDLTLKILPFLADYEKIYSDELVEEDAEDMSLNDIEEAVSDESGSSPIVGNIDDYHDLI